VRGGARAPLAVTKTISARHTFWDVRQSLKPSAARRAPFSQPGFASKERAPRGVISRRRDDEVKEG
jgi:hypothetical protein